MKNENIKGGTIKDLVEEFLKESNSPKHISEIFEYVQKYRNTNWRSVMTNVEIDNPNRFQFFNGDYIGLKEKIYGLEIFNYKRVIGTHFTLKMLVKLNGLYFEKAIKQYVSKYGYTHLQVRHLLQKKIVDGIIKITHDNKIKIVE